jgi:hypothetical protein
MYRILNKEKTNNFINWICFGLQVKGVVNTYSMNDVSSFYGAEENRCLHLLSLEEGNK